MARAGSRGGSYAGTDALSDEPSPSAPDVLATAAGIAGYVFAVARDGQGVQRLGRAPEV